MVFKYILQILINVPDTLPKPPDSKTHQTKCTDRENIMQLNEIIQHTEKLSPQLQAEVFDFILHLEKKQAAQLLSAQQRKQRLKKALDNAVALNIFAGVDGVAWQKEQRQDRDIGYNE